MILFGGFYSAHLINEVSRNAYRRCFKENMVIFNKKLRILYYIIVFGDILLFSTIIALIFM